MNVFLTMFFGLVSHIGTLSADSAKLYATIAHGEGGPAKVAASLTQLAGLLSDTAGAATGVNVGAVNPPLTVAAGAAG